MVFLDINTFFSLKAGGIRTYHLAKMEWFARQTEHRYVVVHPGPCHREISVGPAVNRSEVFGPALTKDASGYRLLLDYWRVLQIIRRERPAVLEAGDAWLTGLFCLVLKKSGWYDGRLISFFHSDPVPSYFLPWANRGNFKALKKILVRCAGRIFYSVQRQYDCTIVSSRTMEKSLNQQGIKNVACLPFGVPLRFLDSPTKFSNPIGTDSTNRLTPPSTASASHPIRLLYAGRLDAEKGMDVLLAALPELLSRSNVHVTIMGRGAFADRLAAFAAPNFEYLGFVDSPEKVLEIYDRSDILLAPGPFETFGLGVLEGMARGLAVVGPDQGGTAELLLQAQGQFVFRAGSPKDFLRAVDEALSSPILEASKKSRKLAVVYGSWDAAIGRMVNHHLRAGENRP